MDKNKPVSGELAALVPLLGHTMEGATQALRQSSALAEVLIAKGNVTKAELDAAMKSNDHLASKLREAVRNLGDEPN